jgi:hypothetical protein
VTNAQATLALPMLCFLQVLFAGAIVPVPDMAGPGQVMSAGLANRWAFESLGRASSSAAWLRPQPSTPHLRGARWWADRAGRLSWRCSWPERSPVARRAPA